MKREFNQVYQFKITFKYIKPSIWRIIQVPEEYTFWDLHVAIQDSMGWKDCHSHEFRMIKPATGLKVNIGIPDEFYSMKVLPCRTEKISEYFSPRNRDADYIYDFGDSWEHAIELEKILPRKKDVEYPVSVGGKRACPPEDCGGFPGYENFLKIISNPEHEEYAEMLRWIGGKFDPEYFDRKNIVFDDPEKRWKLVNS